MSPAMTKLRDAFARMRGISIRHDLSGHRAVLERINSREATLRDLGDAALQDLSRGLLVRVRDGDPGVDGPGTMAGDDVVEAVALAREASRRVVGMRPFDVQVLAALAMYQGNVVEMQTGEGKTLAAVLSAHLRAVEGHGVHVLTFNNYLARRDAAWMGPIYRFLGLTVGVIQEGMSTSDRAAAYRCDVTYATAKEAGFDLLRDSLCFEPDAVVHHSFHCAIVDEADSILIDEARIPLVIAGQVATEHYDPRQMAALVARLDPDAYEIASDGRDVHFTDAGIDRIEEELGCGSLHAPHNYRLLNGLSLALHAFALLRREVDYVVRDGEIALVDEFTGRIADNRHWPAGLQTAIEAKEGIALKPEGVVLGQITIQHYVKRYASLCGMTATARPAAPELDGIYGLGVVVIPPNRPCIRVDEPDRLFADKSAKQRALVAEIERVHATGRPVLIGTSSVEESELLSAALAQRGVGCQVLNAKTDGEREAEIIAEAGDVGAVTVSTNMAGRGTDIRLGGASEERYDEVVALGGLYVIGTNRHESRRIDDQLRGRAGRQGDPGGSRYFISLQDDIWVRYGLTKSIPPRLLPDDTDQPIGLAALLRWIGHAQRVIEGQNGEIRQTLARYFDLVEHQRQSLHSWRHDVLHGQDEVLRERSPAQWARALDAIGRDALVSLGRRIILFHLDRSWSGHIEYASSLREGIHLLAAAGRSPLTEYNRQVRDEFAPLRQEIEDAAVTFFESLQFTDAGASIDPDTLRGPSATWTFLINDDPFARTIEGLLGRNTGVAAGAAFFAGPIIFLVALWRRLRRRRRR